ncbi:RHS repeat-associated core domain-containing protein [Nonomuraea turcica]|uniref:RHS repeat-associated core domain-containing protein n=1 Tax=Nonomuraea sp. G32 TaxID=3067274 RepID=UPI00273BA01C|nr:RHS repeat-associated core domain-containing protein [Nonomuraea sp. G32]MDP4509370.1 RHS repeat-associated core domain-containing protein [Nonomuraea sp. G32]
MKRILTITTALLITMPLMGGETLAAAPQWSPPVPEDVASISVKDLKGGTAPKVVQPPRAGAPHVSWPPAATTVADLALPDRAPGTPVWVGRPNAALASGAATGKVGLRVHDRATTGKAGVTGLLFTVARTEKGAAGPVSVGVDYSGFGSAYGGDWASRLRLVELPPCALTAPGTEGCGLDAATPVSSRNDTATRELTADVRLPADGASMVLAATAGASGDNGDYRATSLSPSSTWQVSQQSGGFSWSYPLRLPPGAGGPVPSLSLSYSSQTVDGRTGGTNTQGSWIGDGWDLWPGFIERTYKSCASDTDQTGGNDPNNKGDKTGDQCWWKANATMSLNGRATELIDVGGGRWKGVSDDGSRIELIKDTGVGNGDQDGEYWKVTTIDGTQYFFGGDAASKSTWTTQVYGNHPGEPGHAAGDFAGSRRSQAWRWNLNHVRDPHGNTMSLFYDREQGAYGRENDPGKRTLYDRGGWLSRIQYGTRTDQAQPAAQVVFDVADRCLPGATCFDSTQKPVAASWPDTPWDQYCQPGARCTEQGAPTYWTQKRLAKVRAQVWDASLSPAQYRTVESWALRHSYLNAGSSRAEGVPMWLDGITRTGSGVPGGASTAHPEIVFSPGADPFPNRVDGPSDGRTALNRFRIVSITTESGAQIGVTYLPGDCTRSSLPTQHSNTKRCMPQYYSPDGTEPTLDWFHKYVVARVDVYDNTGGFSHEQTNYDYLDTPAWHYDDSELTEEKKRTWGQWRGYGRVRVRTGLETQSATEYRYFRGMDGDKQPTGTRDVWVRDSLDGTGDPHSKPIEDHEALAGRLREQITYDGLGGTWLTGSLVEPAHTQTGVNTQGGPLKSYLVSDATTAARTHLTWNDTTRWTKTITKVNADNLPIEVSDLGDESTASDDRCIKTTYLINDTMRNRVSQVNTYGVACTATPAVPGDVLSMTRSYFDDPSKPFGTAPTRGLVVKTEEVGSWSGSTPQWVVTAIIGYDANGRTTSSADALGRTTTTGYTPAKAGPVTAVTTTDPAGHATTTTMEIAWQQPKLVEAPNAARTDLVYDGLGRLTAVWLPGRDRAQGADTTFTYLIRANAPSAITSRKLLPTGTNKYLTSVTLFDGLLRERQSQTQAVGGGRLITDTVRDSRGLVAWTSAPYYHDGSAPVTTLVTPTTAIPSVTENHYDGSGRITETVLKANGVPRWKTVTTHGGDRTTVLPPAGGTKTESLLDARGRTTQLRQYRTGTAFDATDYTYTDGGALASVTDAAGNVWRYTYDQRGRKIKTADPDKGVSESTYDAAGQLVTVTDARKITLAYTYDALGRKTSLRDAAGNPLAEWIYDTAANGVGKPAKSIRHDGANLYVSEVIAYDPGGRPTDTKITIPAAEGALAGSYAFSTTYNQDGQIDSTTSPATGGLPAETLTFGYNAVGAPTYLSAGSQIYVNDVIYNQRGQAIQRILGQDGKRVWQTSTIDEPTGRTTNFSVVPEFKSEVVDFGYAHDDAGNVTRIADTPNGGQPADYQCYTTDYLRRLVEAWTPSTGDCAAARSLTGLGGPASYWHSYSYTLTGGRDVETWHAATNTVRDYAQPPQGGAAGSKPHAVTRIDKSGAATGSDTFAYDAAGNTTSRTVGGVTTTLAWDKEGHLASSTQGGLTTTNLYDVDGTRMLRRDSGGVTLYLPGGLELRRTGSTVTGTRHYSHLGTAIAVRTPSALSWTAQDHHNTTEALIKATDLSVSRRRTLPFGGVRGTAPAGWAGDKGFVDGTNDPNGLTHIGAREYDPALGAFISVDPIIDVNDPQQMHGFAYSNNNPVTMADPTGLRACADDVCGSGGGGAAPVPVTQGSADRYADKAGLNWCDSACARKRIETSRAADAQRHQQYTRYFDACSPSGLVTGCYPPYEGVEHTGQWSEVGVDQGIAINPISITENTTAIAINTNVSEATAKSVRNSIEVRGKLEKLDIAYVRTWGEDTTTTEGVAAIQTEEVDPGARVAYLAPVIAVRWVQTDYYARTYDPNNGNYKRGEFVNSSFRMEVSVIRYVPVQANQQPLGDDRDIISRISGPQW